MKQLEHQTEHFISQSLAFTVAAFAVWAFDVGAGFLFLAAVISLLLGIAGTFFKIHRTRMERSDG